MGRKVWTEPSAWKWVNMRIPFCHSILNKKKIYFLKALVHDLAESLVGDITPYCGISKEEKKKKELEAMQEIANLIEPRGKHLMELFLVSECFVIVLINNTNTV